MFATLAAALLACALPGPAFEDAEIDAKAAFERLKSLAGQWSCRVEGQEAGTYSYRVTAAGSAVVETLFEGTDHEMISMYHLDGDDLRLTHYCAAGNQPHLKLDLENSKPDTLRFVFDGGTNLDPEEDMHMHEGVIHLEGEDDIRAEWTGYAGGKPSGTHEFQLKRR